MRTVRRSNSPAQDLSLAARHFMKRRASDLAGIALIAFAITMAIALITWSVGDPSLTHATDGRVANWLGAPGAILADMAMQLLGLGSVAWLLPIAVWGVSLVTHHAMPGMKWRIPLWLVGAAATAGVASAMPATGSWPLPTGLGGVVGDALLSGGRTVFNIFGGFGRALAGFAMAAVAILALSAACGYGFDDPTRDDEEPESGSWRGSREKNQDLSDQDTDEPGLGIVSLGAAVHGFMMLKAALGRRRIRRRMAGSIGLASAPGQMARTRASTRVEPTAFGDEAVALRVEQAAERSDVLATASPRLAEPPRSRVRMPPAWSPHSEQTAATGALEPPWHNEAAPSPVHAAYAPARVRAEVFQDAAHQPVEEPFAEPTLLQSPETLHHMHGETSSDQFYNDAPAIAAGLAQPAPGALKIIPTAAAIAAAAELSSRFAARVRRKSPVPDMAQSDEGIMDDDLQILAKADIQPDSQSPQTPFVLDRRRREAENIESPEAEDGVDVNATICPVGSRPINLPNLGAEPVTSHLPIVPAHALRIGVPSGINVPGPANDDGAAITTPAVAPASPIARARQLPKQTPPVREDASYRLPELALLSEPRRQAANSMVSAEALEQNATLLEGVLEDFGVRGEIINVRPGPVVTLYELEPAPGTKSSRVISLADDIARSMSAISARVAVVPGRNVIGIELPNVNRETVFLRELLASEDFSSSKSRLGLCLGKTIGGEPVIVDLARMPHLLVAGTTGSGKSVAINTMILSLIYRLRPDECRLIMVDPKMLELSIYDGIPHLLTPVVTDPKKAVVALKWAVREMEDRYKKMSKLGVRNIDGFNVRIGEAKLKGEIITRTLQTGFDKQTGEPIYEEEVMDLDPLPYIVVIVDEMADLMMVAGKEIEGTIQRLAQMARAAGIHVVLATQRPSVDVITGTIKANFPTRISFQVTSKIDSRTILGEQGAEQLLGQGDMLYMAGGGRITRVHGPFVSDNEVEKVVAHLKSQGRPLYLDAVTSMENESEAEEGGAVFDQGSMGSATGDLYDQAVAIVLRDQKASTSYIQRRLQIGYNRAASLMERMELEGIVGAANHAGKREIMAQSTSDSDA